VLASWCAGGGASAQAAGLQGAEAPRPDARQGESEAQEGPLQARQGDEEGLAGRPEGQGHRSEAEAGQELKNGAKVNVTVGKGP